MKMSIDSSTRSNQRSKFSSLGWFPAGALLVIAMSFTGCKSAGKMSQQEQIAAAAARADAMAVEQDRQPSRVGTDTEASSALVVYVTGAVGRAGRVVSERQLTAFEAIVEAGGFNSGRANLKKVRIIRYHEGEASYFTVNVKAVLTGKEDKPFLLKPLDILYVPERFTWF
jgi:hypothetical protein